MADRTMPQAGQLYRHFKGNMYQVIGIARHSETMEQLVVYQALYGDFGLYVRPVDMFLSEVDHNKYPDISATYRFTLVNRESLVNEKSKVKNSSTPEKEMNVEDKTANKVNEILSKSPIKKTENESIEQPVDALDESELHPEAGLVNRDLMDFLDARDYGEKLEVLYTIRKRIDERLMSDIEMSMDLMPGKGTIDERIMVVRDNLQTLSKYETKRLR